MRRALEEQSDLFKHKAVTGDSRQAKHNFGVKTDHYLCGRGGGGVFAFLRLLIALELQSDKLAMAQKALRYLSNLFF